MIKLIALDLDGTLLPDDKKITQATREVLIEAQQKGCTVALASARPTVGLVKERKALELDRYHGILITYNGARILDATAKTLLYERNMAPGIVTALLRHLEAFPVAVMVDDNEAYYTTDPTAYKVAFERSVIGIPFKIVDNMAEAITFPIPKVLIVAPGPVLDQVMDPIKAPFADDLDFFRVGDFYIEVTIKDFSKAVGLTQLCQRRGIPMEQVVAFGDSQNDQAMLETAGLGVAMCNADPGIQASADAVTRYSNNEDGVVRFIMDHHLI